MKVLGELSQQLIRYMQLRRRWIKGKLKISYVGTKEQCVDALTKFLRSGTDQVKAREHLSLVDVSDCQTGRGEQVKACGLVNSSLSAG